MSFAPVISVGVLLVAFFVLYASLDGPRAVRVDVPDGSGGVARRRRDGIGTSRTVALLLKDSGGLCCCRNRPGCGSCASLGRADCGPSKLETVLLGGGTTTIHGIGRLGRRGLRLGVSRSRFAGRLSRVGNKGSAPAIVVGTASSTSCVGLVSTLSRVRVYGVNGCIVAGVTRTSRFLVGGCSSGNRLSRGVTRWLDGAWGGGGGNGGEFSLFDVI